MAIPTTGVMRSVRQPTCELSYEGKDNGETRIRDLQRFVERQSYTSNGTGSASNVSTCLFIYYDELEVLGLPTTEANKL